MDATQPVRDFLVRNNIHDYETQKQGPDGKVVLQSRIITDDDVVDCSTSLYRPQTKSGDPRIWFSGLGKFCKPHDVIAVFYFDNFLWIFNVTNLDISHLINSGGPLKEIADSYQKEDSLVHLELLSMLKGVAKRGYLESTLDADTAVGRLLETELGIPINSSKNPDYKGIEIKSFRGERNNRKNLFAQVANWDLSKIKSSREMLDAYGYDRDGIRKLYCTVSTKIFNSQGLKLRMNEKAGLLTEFSNADDMEDVLVWDMSQLNKRLLDKHAKTFWVKADVKKIKGKEFFRFSEVEYTKSPIVTQFGTLLSGGQITLDHLIKENGASVNEKGPIFKLEHTALPLLFPPSEIFNLID